MYWKTNKIFRETIGWCPEAKADYLCGLLETHKPDKILEIGVFAGKSFFPMAHTAQRYGGKAIGIEPFTLVATREGKNPVSNDEWWGKLNYNDLESGVNDSIERWGLADTVTIMKMTSKEALPSFTQEFGLIHQDSNHSEEVSFWETSHYAPLLKQGGYYVLDDIDWKMDDKLTNKKSISLLDKMFTRVHWADSTSDQWAVWQNG